MTIRTFWTILLKILGISLVLRGVNVILNLISVLSSTLSAMSYSDIEDDTLGLIGYIAAIFGVVIIYAFILWLFVFKTSWIINKLRLEKGFIEERIELNIHLSTILKIATIVIGGIMIIDSLPLLCQQVFIFFQQKSIFRESPTAGWIILNSVKAFLGFLLITNSSKIITFINTKSVSSDLDKNSL